MESLFEESTSPTETAPTHTLWVEKYRPTELSNYIGNDQLKHTVESFLKKNDIPHLLLYGNAGVGKTALAKLIGKNMDCDVMYINASDETGVDTVRNKIKGFAASTGFRQLKVVILDECDFISLSGQAALRNLMETFSLTTRFILTCNYHEKMLPAIISRCQTYQINPISKKEVAIHLTKILNTENIKYTPEDIGYIVNTYYPDIRKILNYAQQSVVDGKISIYTDNSVETDVQEKFILMIKNGIGKPAAFNEIRQLIADAEIHHFDEYFDLLYSKMDEYASKKQALATVIIAEYAYQCSLLTGDLKEISFMACVSKLLNDLRN